MNVKDELRFPEVAAVADSSAVSSVIGATSMIRSYTALLTVPNPGSQPRVSRGRTRGACGVYGNAHPQQVSCIGVADLRQQDRTTRRDPAHTEPILRS